MSCQARHAFAYTGALTNGTALSPRTSAPILRDGRAWGAGVASYHALGHGTEAILDSLLDDAGEQKDAGTFDQPTFDDAVNRLSWMLQHYVAQEPEPLFLVERERELMVPIRSRKGTRRSTVYRLHAFLDGVHIDVDGRVWIVEFKLRGRLQNLEQILLNRQIRWYAWAWRETTGEEPAGVIVEERLNALPSPVAFNKNGAVSKVQSCDAAAYMDACAAAGHGPDDEVFDRLRAKDWQLRHRILLRSEEIDEAALQITSAAEQTHSFDSGALYPVRNPSPARCPSCPFKPICADPSDVDRVDSLYFRSVPKWARAALEAKELAA